MTAISTLAAVAQGVTFVDKQLDEALAMAKKEGKMVFVDCYGTYCPPCKKMLVEEFPKKEMGDYLNAGFISVKYNLDKEPYKELAKRWEVSMYPTFVKYFDDELTDYYTQNVEKAKELLAEAGYPDGFTCTMTCDQNQQRLDTAEMVQMQLAEIGITMKIASMERGTFIDNVISGNLEMFGLGWTADTGDPDYALFASFHSSMHGEGGNMSFYTNPEVDRLLDLGRSSTDPEVRKDAYYKVQEIVWNEVPCVFLQCPEDLYAYNSNLKNFATNADGSIKFAQLSWN